MSTSAAQSTSAAERWQTEALDSHVAIFVAALRRGHGVQVTSEPSTSRHPGINGLVALPKQSTFARQIAEKAERRASTANSPLDAA